ncbi:hypothetical protein DQ04_00401130 [Trypanosoma grayi]|uniref:hypothetical protein n=1 Tax=Trypanosoma grayi TaxID=71804 RepID=UPI0004F457DC|nr:hypothetical protein DQ04_00401130 [Trypanosoma grayi]KEG14573.1 hypothetical protein DQ04_00401130 [Trypanosoma grayi]
MDPTASPAASTPSRRSCSAFGVRCRALTVNLMELMDCRDKEKMVWTEEDIGCTAAYVAFEPERLWQAASIDDKVDSTEADSYCVLVVFADRSLGVDAALSGPSASTISDGSVLQFLTSRTDLLEHLKSSAPLKSSVHSCEEGRVEGDGVADVMLFTDVEMENLDAFHRLSVVCVQLAIGDGRMTVDPAKAQQRAAQIIDTALALSPDSARTTFWVDFTGVLDSARCLVPRELREAWWSLSVVTPSSLFSSASVAPRVTALVPAAAVPQLKLRYEQLVMDVAGAKTHGDGGGKDGDAFQSQSCQGMPLRKRRRADRAHRDELESARAPTAHEEGDDEEPIWNRHTRILVDGMNDDRLASSHTSATTDEAKEEDEDDVPIWKRYAETLVGNAGDRIHETSSASAVDCEDKVDEDENDEPIWKKYVETLVDGTNSLTHKSSYMRTTTEEVDEDGEPICKRQSGLMVDGTNDDIRKSSHSSRTLDKEKEDEDDEGDVPIWKRYVETLVGTAHERKHDTSFVSRFPEEDVEDDDKPIWKKHMSALRERVKSPLRNATKEFSCLFLECPCDSVSSSLGCEASIRELLVLWSALGVHHLPRTIVVVVDSDDKLERVLRSWVQVPWSENALILPVLAVSDPTIRRNSSGSVAKSSSLAPEVPDDVPSSCEFLKVLAFAVQYIGIDVQRSACLAVTEPFQRAAELLHFQAVGGYERIFSWAGEQSHANAGTPRGPVDVERERGCAFADLCVNNDLARALRDRPRRPEILLRRVGSMRVGIVRPVVCDAVALASTVMTEARMNPSLNSIVSLSPQQRSWVYRYMMSFFTKAVFCVSVDVVRSCNADYFSSYHFSTVGYLRYELTSWVRRHVLVDLHVDLQPILKESSVRAAGVNIPHWSRVFRRLSCTCTPRRHEKLLRTETGEKKCRHLAQLLYWFLRKCGSDSTPLPPRLASVKAPRQGRRCFYPLSARSANVDGLSAVVGSQARHSSRSIAGITNGGADTQPKGGETKSDGLGFSNEVEVLDFARLLGMTAKS